MRIGPRAGVLLYAVFSVGAIGFGVLTLVGAIGVPATPEEGHLTRELGAAAVFVGLMLAWCSVHYARRLPVHLALMVLAALIAWIHWQDWFAGLRPWTSGVLNTVPLVVLAVMLLGNTAPARAGAPQSD